MVLSNAKHAEFPTLSTDLLAPAAAAEDRLLASADALMPTADALPIRCLVIRCRAESWLLLLLRALFEPVSLKLLLLLPLLARALPVPCCFGGLRCLGGLGLGVMLGLPAGGVLFDSCWVTPSVADPVGTSS